MKKQEESVQTVKECFLYVLCMLCNTVMHFKPNLSILHLGTTQYTSILWSTDPERVSVPCRKSEINKK